MPGPAQFACRPTFATRTKRGEIHTNVNLGRVSCCGCCALKGFSETRPFVSMFIKVHFLLHDCNKYVIFSSWNGKLNTTVIK